MEKKLSLITALILLLSPLGMTALGDGKTPNDPVMTFSLRLFRQAALEKKQNPVISPLSAYLAMAMAGLGAQGETKEEFEGLLETTPEAAAALSRDLSWAFMDTRGNTKLEIANAGWIDDDAKLLESYLSSVRAFFQAGLHVAELSLTETRTAINDWVSEKTRGLIPLILEKNLSENAVFALLNTVYFKAWWMADFDPHSTYARDFHMENGETSNPDFLHDADGFRAYIDAGDAEGVLLPYDDGKTAFMALRPKNGLSLRNFAASLTPDKLRDYREAANETMMDLAMPAFTLEYTLQLDDTLRQMGFGKAFDPEKADFSGMGSHSNGNIFISSALQKVKVEVNEEGTEAAAVTAIIMEAMAMPPQETPVSLVLDSPYVYMVLDLDSGLPLFIGLMDNPAA